MNSLLFRAHAVQRMFERGVSVGKVREALKAEDVILLPGTTVLADKQAVTAK